MQIMASPMGASIISSKQAVIISSIFGLIGVLISGHHVSASYTSMVFIATPHESFVSIKAILVFVVTVFVWMYIAQHRSALFSLTYTVVCSLIGSYLFGVGVDAVNWLLVVSIMLAWLVSPFINYFLTIYIYRFLRHLIFKKSDPVMAMRKAGPLSVFTFISIFTFIVYYNGISIDPGSQSIHFTLLISCLFGTIFYIVSVFKVKKIPSANSDNSIIAETNTENLVKPLALLIVFVLPFSLGANSVANGIGPLLLTLQTDAATLPSGLLNYENLRSPTNVLLVAGGFIFVIGLVFSGFRLIDELSRKFTELTPVRSFSIIIATSTTIMIGTSLGMPLSTFHTAVGGVLAFSYLTAPNGESGNIELGRFIGSFFVPWFLTIPGTFFIAAILHLLTNLVLA